MRTLVEIPAYRLLSKEGNVSSGNPLSYYVAEIIDRRVFIYQPTPTIVAAFVNESDAELFIKAGNRGYASYKIYVSAKHYEFHAKLLPELREKYKDRIL